MHFTQEVELDGAMTFQNVKLPGDEPVNQITPFKKKATHTTMDWLMAKPHLQTPQFPKGGSGGSKLSANQNENIL